MRPTARLKRSCAGSTMLEFTLVAIPMIFVLISTFEIARGMWMYVTLANAIKEGTRFTIVKGSDCGIAPNACSAKISDIAGRIHSMGVGLISTDLNLSFVSDTGTVSCSLDSCLTQDTVWPPAGDDAKGQQIQIHGVYPFRSAIAMFWPGSGKPQSFGKINLNATSQDVIQF